MIAATAALTYATGGLAAYAGPAVGTTRAVQVGNTIRTSATLQ